tara:strand:+ start:1797 stop:2117 length:321 start_codon:yes stop_codon:yes gene_type:complete
MDTPRYKVAYMETNSPFRLYSDFFPTQTEAQDYASKLRQEGFEAMTFVKAHQEGVHYEWDLIKDRSTWKYRLGIFLTSSKFVVPLVLIIFAYLLLRRGNGLPRVIG